MMKLSEALEAVSGAVNCAIASELVPMNHTRLAMDAVADALRWRPWPQEQPEKEGDYFVNIMIGDNCRMVFIVGWWNNAWGEEISQANIDRFTHWLPINWPDAGNERSLT